MIDWLIAGLGNPGEDYSLTRHNAGYLVNDYLFEKYKGLHWIKNNKAMTARLKMRKHNVILLKSLTFMNLSGITVKDLAQKYDLCPKQIIAIHDDLDLEAGRVKAKFDGSSGGHRGLESIITSLNTAGFYRIRIGIGRPPDRNASSFVLQRVEESKGLDDFTQAVAKAATVAETLIFEGAVAAMNRFNRSEINANRASENARKSESNDV